MPLPKDNVTTISSKLNEAKDDKSPELLQQIAKELYGKNLDLSKERKRLQEILHQVAEVVFAVDPEYKITLFNSSAEKIFDISRENALEQNPDEFIILKTQDGTKIVS